MIPVVLWLLGILRPLYRALGVDFTQLRAIVGAKLLMDNRRNTTAFQQQKKQPSSNFALVILMYAVLGIFMAVVIVNVPSILVAITLFHSFLMVMVIMTLVSDFSAVLLDTSDNTIILPRPVSGRTLAASRVTHILLYIGQLTAGLVIAPLIAVAWVYGPWITFLVFVSLAFSVLFAVTFTNGLYLLLMQITSEEKLKSAISYFQIGVTIVMMGGYQILPRMIGPDLLAMVDFRMNAWFLLIPPFWMGAALELAQHHTFDAVHVLAVCFATGVPVGGFYAVNKYLAPFFAGKLADLGTGNVPSPDKDSKKISNPSFLLSAVLTRPGLEKGAYSLTSALMSRDRKLKMKIYPSIASLFILAFVILLQGKSSVTSMLNSLPRTSTHIFLLYTPFFFVQTALAEICFTDEFRAAWIYTSAPVNRPGEILSGAWKAVVVRFYVPVFTVFVAFILFMWRERAFDDIYFAICSNLFLLLAVANIGAKRFPFSMEPSTRHQAGSFARTMMMFFLLLVMGGLHFLLSKVPYALWIGGPLLLMGSIFLMKALKATPLKDFEF